MIHSETLLRYLKPNIFGTLRLQQFCSRILDGNESRLSHNSKPHTPVLTREAIELLSPQNGNIYVDMTFGAGGHTRAILEAAPEAKIFALDRDRVAFNFATAFSKNNQQVVPLLGKFSDLPGLLYKEGVDVGTVDGFLFDVGASSMQFDQPERGFSLSRDGPLDMRMGSEIGFASFTAADVVNNLSEEHLSAVIRCYGQEKMAKKMAAAIVEYRRAYGNITMTQQLAKIINNSYRGPRRSDKLKRYSHPATKTFQALRIFVNNELNELYNGINIAGHYLKIGGHCAVISFHSLEAVIAKRLFRDIDMDLKLNMTLADWHRMKDPGIFYDDITMEKMRQKSWQEVGKVIMPSEEEIKTNERARSAQLRVAKKIAEPRDETS